MNLYTDGTTKASTDEITTALADSQAADITAERDETAAELQTWIDGYYDGREWDYVAEDWKADPADFEGDKTLKLKAAGVTAVADEVDEQWVVVQLPTDADGQPKFWSGQAASIGEDLGANKARSRKDLMRVELARISALL
tara:strand:+ start:2783 stop:3205 length:423 start_codon:yes stop_codon:yes gene_type:complete